MKPRPTLSAAAKPASELILYQTEDNQTRIEVRLENETVWLTQAQMAELFQTTIPNVSVHVRNIFAEGELQAGSVVKEFLTTAADGKNYTTKFHNLDAIILSANKLVSWKMNWGMNRNEMRERVLEL